MIEDHLRGWAAARGYGIAVAGAGVVDVVRRKLEELRTSRMIDPGFYAENLGSFRFLDGLGVRGPISIVMVAVPSPVLTLPVTSGGKVMETLIPPTYVRYRAVFDEVLADMKANALPPGVGAEALKAPLKSLAAHMGLVAYGRNNVTYRPGLGSGHQLCGYALGIAPETDDAAAAGGGRENMLERCRDCRACIEACPTGAIRKDRFLISAERCYTLLSESRRPFPDWARLPKAVCLIGCMTCQHVCPENRGRLQTEPSGVELNGEETEALLEAGRKLGAVSGADTRAKPDPPASPAGVSAWAKIDRLGMTEDIEVMGRNLGLFLRRARVGEAFTNRT
jgi:epoxyqueuosine reductase